MTTTEPQSCTAFQGAAVLARGTLSELVAPVGLAFADPAARSPLVFVDETGAPVDIVRRADGQVSLHQAAPAERSVGRPKLGVTAREVTLLPRHWDWLATQPGGASASLRRLIERESRGDDAPARRRKAQEACYRVMSAVAGDLPGFEAATRALFAGAAAGFAGALAAWPEGLRQHFERMAAPAFEGLAP